MNDALDRMIDQYQCRSVGDYVSALREILQQLSLLGLWRAKFFEKAAFYGGAALRILYGLDRFSEDMDFSLLFPTNDFNLSFYANALQKELLAFGFEVSIQDRATPTRSGMRSAFLKATTIKQVLVVQADETLVKQLHREQKIKIKLEVDTDPPSGFETETRYVLQPIPFSVRTYVLPDLFAGKMHAILCRRWKSRSKGRDWYDLVWYAANHPDLHLAHLEQRMRQSSDWSKPDRLSPEAFRQRIDNAIDALDVDQVRKEVEPFARNPDGLAVWSRSFFRDVAGRIRCV